MTLLPEKPLIPRSFRFLNALVGGLGAERLSRLGFESEVLMERACRRTGLDDFGNSAFQTGLQEFLKSLRDEAQLSPIGRIGLLGLVVTLLMNRLWLSEARAVHPGRFQTPLLPPLIILGMPRAGTTFLHRLLCVDSSMRALPLWRLMRPISPRTADHRRREAERTLSLRRRLTPQLDLKHFVRAESAEECIWLLNSSFVSHGLWVAAPVYGYLDWLLEDADRLPSYAEYALYLSYFQDEEPERRLLLKAPNHSGSLAELRQVLPEACIVQLHRDPVAASLSLNSLFYTVHSAQVQRIDVARMARTNVEMLEREMRRNLAARRDFPGRVLDVSHADLSADPISVVRQIYRHFGFAWDEQLQDAFRVFAARNSPGKAGIHRYSAADLGLSEADLRQRFAFYCDQFRQVDR